MNERWEKKLNSQSLKWTVILSITTSMIAKIASYGKDGQ